MKKYYFSYFLIPVICIVFFDNMDAQQVSLGPETMESQDELVATDALLDKTRYYKNTQIDLKAGEGIFLYMITEDFEPQLFTLTISLTDWVLGEVEDYGLDFYISYTAVVAERDTSFHVVYTSVDDFEIGEFIYGAKKMTAEQMQYNVAADFCNRLTYLINNWQCYWQLIPIHNDIEDIWVIEKTNNTLMNNGTGFMDEYGISDYYETIYSGQDSKKAKDQYDELVLKTTQCLKPEQWDIKSQTIPEEDSDAIVHSTDFTVKGGIVNQEINSFTIEYLENTDEGYIVTIRFF